MLLAATRHVRSTSPSRAAGPLHTFVDAWRRWSVTDRYDRLLRLPYALACAVMLAKEALTFVLFCRRAVVDPALVADPAFVSTALARLMMTWFLAVMVLLTVVRQRPITKAPGLLPRLEALGGTFFTLGLVLFPPRDLSVTLNLVSAALLFSGSGFSMIVASRLGRSFSIMPEARRLVTTGIYGWVRHPLYVAEEISIIGVFLQVASVWTALLVVAHWCIQMARAANEERVLQTVFPEYPGYAARTARFIPGVY